MKTIFYLFLCLVFCSNSFAFLKSLGSHPTAFMMPKGQLETTLTHYQINSTLDILNIRDLTKVQAQSLGNMKGNGISLKFGASKLFTILYDRKKSAYEYSRGAVGVNSEYLGVKYVLKDMGPEKPLISLQIGHRKNRGAGLSKIFTTVSFQNASFVLNPSARLDFGGVKDKANTYMLVASKQLRKKLMGSIFAEYSFGSVRSELASNIPIPELNSILNVLNFKTRKRDFGYSLHYKMNSSNMLSLDYHYILMDRSVDVSDPIDVNEVINAQFTQGINDQSEWFLSAKYLKNNFVGEHPFLYNKLSASRFDKKYGYLGVGYTFKYGYSN
ncbi:MAG: hypothetical protein COB02_11860 [Candidatus Cloacimonadota bacterium]|nr:MAG: hypothetical protein COB02_11860 [Candidatus Cloacimonadota bacterium]